MDSFLEPKPTGLNKDAIYRIAEAVATQLDFQPGNNLHDLVTSMGGTIKYCDVWQQDSGDSGSTIVRRKNDFDIFLGTNTSPERDNFTIAHELGHYVLHYLIPQDKTPSDRPFRANRYGSDRTEWEANWFAAAFLMPKTAFSAEVRQQQGNLAAVAKHFAVSFGAVQIRAKALKLSN